MGGGGWKRVAFGGNKKGLCERKAFGFPKKLTFSVHAKQTEKEKLFQLMQSQPIKKSIFQHCKTLTSHRTKANEQLQISSVKTYCELAVQ